MFFPETLVDTGNIASWQMTGEHLQIQISIRWPQWRIAERREMSSRRFCSFDGCRAHIFPIVRSSKIESGRHAEISGEILRAVPIVAAGEAGAIKPAMADHQWHHVLVQRGIDGQEGGALGRTEPLVTVAGVGIGAKRAHVQRDLTGGVGAVDDGEDVRRPRSLDQSL